MRLRIFLFLLLIAALNTNCKKDCVLDSGMKDAHNTFPFQSAVAQTFTPTQSGTLTEVIHGLQGNVNYDLLITDTDSNGLPNYNLGGSLTGSNIIYVGQGLNTYATGGLVNGTVAIPHVQGQKPVLFAGIKYALILVPNSTGAMLWRGSSGSGSYTGGDAYEWNNGWTLTTGIEPKDFGFVLNGRCN